MIGETGTFLIGLAAAIVAINGLWNTYKLRRVESTVEAVKTQSNGMLEHIKALATQLGYDAGMQEGHAAGVADEKAAERKRND